MASISGILGGLGTCPYSVSKFAIAGIVKAATAELSRHDVRVNCISPYAVPTLGGAADEAQVAATIRGLGELKGATCEAVDIDRAPCTWPPTTTCLGTIVVDDRFTSYKHMNLPFPTKPQE
jgi:NAD(P)-dependent dehydrogenase (short-subunit alcohol dehydrogenase family)